MLWWTIKRLLARANEEIQRLQNLLSKALAKLEGADSGGDGGTALAAELRAVHTQGAPGAEPARSGGGEHERELALLQENAQLQAENERLRIQLRRESKGQGNKENREGGQGPGRKRQSQSGGSALGGGKQSLKSSSSHHNSIST